MKESFRQSMAWLHTWAGLIVGWILFLVFMTGSTGYFDDEITHWMQPETPLVVAAAPIALTESVNKAQRLLERRAQGAEYWSINPSQGRVDRQWRLSWPHAAKAGKTAEPSQGQKQGKKRRGARAERVFMDPASGEEIARGAHGKARDTGGGVGLYRLHYKLRYMTEHSALLIVGGCAMLMFVALLSGVITHKKIFKDFFTFRPAKGQRSWLDAHTLVGVAALPFFLVMTYTGLMFFMYAHMPAAMNVAYGADKAWADDGYINPLNPRANSQFDPMAEPGAARARRGASVPASGTPMALADLSGLARQAERQWGKGMVGGIFVERPGDANARVTISRQEEGGLTRGSASQLVFNGVTGKALSAPPQRQAGTWKVQDTMIALHEGLYAGPMLRWIYFLSGLLGCGMVGTGLVLWTAKRKQKQVRESRTDYGFRLVQALNIGTITGLPLGIAAYFWANRLLPVAMPERAEWEFHCLFIAMGTMLLWGALRRPPRKAWEEGLWAVSFAYLLLPVVNMATTDRHLGVSLPAGDWVLAGFDLMMLMFGAAFAAAASLVRHRQADAAPVVRAGRVKALA